MTGCNGRRPYKHSLAGRERGPGKELVKMLDELSEFKNFQKQFDDIAAFRILNKLPKFADEIKDSGTVAKITIKGRSFYGISSGLSPESIALRRRWFKLIKFIPPRRHLGRARFLNHAEAHALINAYEVMGTLAKKVTLLLIERLSLSVGVPPPCAST